MGFFRRKNKKNKKAEAAPVEPELQSPPSKDLEEVASGVTGPGNSDVYNPPSVATSNSSEEGAPPAAYTSAPETSRPNVPWFSAKQTHLFRRPPAASRAAYGGPPRYDWVDIETSAAIKIQAAYRRKQVMDHMAEQGQTTAAARNHARRKKAAKEASSNPTRDFVDLINCCGVDLGLGGGNSEKYFDYTREIEKARYRDSLVEKQEKEAQLRKSILKKPPRASLVENIEVVE